MAVQLAKTLLDAGVVTRDIDAAHRFYGEALGLPLAGEVDIPGYGQVRRYAVGEATLRVFLPLQEPASDGSRDGFASQTGIHTFERNHSHSRQSSNLLGLPWGQVGIETLIRETGENPTS